MNNIYIRIAQIFWQLLLLPWRFLFAFVPPCHIAHGWIAFICSLLFISGIAYIVTKFTDLISCVTGILSLNDIPVHLFTVPYRSKVALLVQHILISFFFSRSLSLSLSDRNKCLRYSIYSTSQWNLMARFSSE